MTYPQISYGFRSQPFEQCATSLPARRTRCVLEARYPHGTPRFEWPVHAEDADGRVLAGRVDLVIDLPDGFVLVDHRSFPGALALDEERLRAFGGQTRAYARALESALSKPSVAVWTHQPVVGVVVRVGVDRKATERLQQS